MVASLALPRLVGAESALWLLLTVDTETGRGADISLFRRAIEGTATREDSSLVDTEFVARNVRFVIREGAVRCVTRRFL